MTRIRWTSGRWVPCLLAKLIQGRADSTSVISLVSGATDCRKRSAHPPFPDDPEDSRTEVYLAGMKKYAPAVTAEIGQRSG